MVQHLKDYIILFSLAVGLIMTGLILYISILAYMSNYEVIILTNSINEAALEVALLPVLMILIMSGFALYLKQMWER